jgi:hypothetical protein
MPTPPEPLPKPTDDEKKQAEKEVEDWLKDNGYPSPDPKKQ